MAKETAEKKLEPRTILNSEQRILNDLSKKLANNYSRILYNKRSIPDFHAAKCTGAQMFLSKIESFEKRDREFYEMIITFTVKVLE